MRDVLGERAATLYLFGSWARGSATSVSDIPLGVRRVRGDDESVKRALEEGLPYQTLISSLLHKYVAGRLREA